MKKTHLIITTSILGFLGCADILYKEKPPIILWGESYSIENTNTLILNNSGLSGPIPPEIGELVNLITLDLSENQLTGEIPVQIERLIYLSNLNLSKNYLYTLFKSKPSFLNFFLKL